MSLNYNLTKSKRQSEPREKVKPLFLCAWQSESLI